MRARDVAGNESSRLRRVSYLAADEQGPFVEITAPRVGATVVAGIVAIRGRARDDVELAQVEVYVERHASNQTPRAIRTSLATAPTIWKPWEAELNTSDFGGAGQYRIWALATDAAGAETETMIEIWVR